MMVKIYTDSDHLCIHDQDGPTTFFLSTRLAAAQAVTEVAGTIYRIFLTVRKEVNV